MVINMQIVNSYATNKRVCFYISKQFEMGVEIWLRNSVLQHGSRGRQ